MPNAISWFRHKTPRSVSIFSRAEICHGAASPQQQHSVQCSPIHNYICVQSLSYSWPEPWLAQHLQISCHSSLGAHNLHNHIHFCSHNHILAQQQPLDLWLVWRQNFAWNSINRLGLERFPTWWSLHLMLGERKIYIYLQVPARSFQAANRHLSSSSLPTKYFTKIPDHW